MDQKIGAGLEIAKLQYKGPIDWLIAFNHPLQKWNTQPTFLVAECAFYLTGLLTFIHAMRIGGRFRYLWFAIYLHGLAVENMSFWLPDIDNFWHAQSSIMLLGRRLPLHITFLYPSFIYTAAVAVSRMRLSKWAEPFAVGLTVVLIDMPFDIVCVKFMHWTWHDTDPNIADRHYYVPWTSYFFHAAFAASVSFFFHFWRSIFASSPNNQWKSDCLVKELFCNLMTVVTGIPGGIILFMVAYHTLHDIYGIGTQNCVVMLLCFFLVIVWSADRVPVVGSRPSRGRGGYPFNEIPMVLLILYTLPAYMLLWCHPEDEVSIGLHEPTGPCDKFTTMQNAVGMTMKKRSFFCASDYDEGYMDFHCLPNQKPPSNGMEWYSVCGTPFSNKVEYVQVIGTIMMVAFWVFYQLLFKSGPEVTCTDSKQSLAGKKIKSQ